jgi:5-methylthioribose kinase
MADEATGGVKIIDPEFVVYGPPGVDLGSLISGYVVGKFLRFTEQQCGQ